MRVRHALVLGLACGLASAAHAAEVAPDDVKIVEGVLDTPLTDVAGDPEAGRAIFTARKKGNCLACHMVTSLMEAEQFHGEVGPPLDGVADSYSIGELRARVVNPKTELPETIMPAFYRTSGYARSAEKFADKTILSAQEVEDLLAYLQTLKE